MLGVILAHLKGSDLHVHVNKLFTRISSRYDLLNNVMSAGRHHAWRKTAARLVSEELIGPALDIATGTGDFAIELVRQSAVSEVVGLDSTEAMISQAKRKIITLNPAKNIALLIGDSHKLPFCDNYFAAVTIGFGIRNFINLKDAMIETVRVLKPSGRVAILEIVRLENRNPINGIFSSGFRKITPLMGAFIARDRAAYTYLPQSVDQFLTASAVRVIMEDSGLRIIAHKSRALGSVTILVGEKISN